MVKEGAMNLRAMVGVCSLVPNVPLSVGLLWRERLFGEALLSNKKKVQFDPKYVTEFMTNNIHLFPDHRINPPGGWNRRRACWRKQSFRRQTFPTRRWEREIHYDKKYATGFPINFNLL